MKDSKKDKMSYTGLLILLSAGLILTILVSMVLGRYPMGIRDVWVILLGKITGGEPFYNPTMESLLLTHRLPRIVVACLVGACLSSAGVSYQGVFKNPMAAPDILGASSGAAFGAALSILLNLGNTMTIVFAFGFSLLTVAIVIIIGNRTKGKQIYGLILAGIMISSMVSSFTSFIKLVADPLDELPAITYWLMGSLNGCSYKDIQFVIIPMIIGIAMLCIVRWRINLLTLGDEEAKTMGVNVVLLRNTVLLCATLITAASVSVSGMIGWVGLVIPHVARRLTGNNYNRLMPVSIISGAIFLLIVDDISRTLLATEIPIGILTSVIGAPFFIGLILKDGERV